MTISDSIRNFLWWNGWVLSHEITGSVAKDIIEGLKKDRVKIFNNDLSRISQICILANEVKRKNVQGAVAELGVFRGDLSVILSSLWKDRKYYLFDTFSGFHDADLAVEDNEGFSDPRERDSFSDTSEEFVKSRLINRSNCIIRKGYFPESAEGLREKWAFVVIDVDLFQPIYSGLEFFYKGLQTGGYIVVHDFNHIGYKGVRPAVDKFCAEKRIPYVPLADSSGSVLLCK